MEEGRGESQVLVMGKLMPSEHEIQSAFMEWVNWQANSDPRFSYFIKIPNEGKRSFWACGKMKKEGMVAGLPDLLCLWPMIPYTGLAIEFKTSTGKISKSQKEWEDKLLRAGWLHDFCRTVDDAIKITELYFGC